MNTRGSLFAALTGLCLVLSGSARAQEDKKAPETSGQKVETTDIKKTSSTKSRAYRLAPPPANFSPPVLAVDEANFDWGTALQGEKVKHSFKITNSGGAPLIINRIKPSCGCTTVDKPEKPIPPGGSELVTLQIDTKNLPAKAKKSADIYSNDSSSPLKVYMSGQVEPLFTIEPKLPKLSIIKGAPADPLRISLRRKGSSLPLKVTGVKTKTNVVKAKVEEIEAGQLYEIEVEPMLGDSARKYYYEQLDVHVEAGEKSLDIPVRVSVTVKDRIDVEPRNSVYFNRNETKKLADQNSPPLSKTLDIKSLGGADHSFKITGIENQGKSFETQLETVEDGRHYRLIVTLPKLPENQARRTVNEKILLKTDDTTVPEIKVTALAAIK